MRKWIRRYLGLDRIDEMRYDFTHLNSSLIVLGSDIKKLSHAVSANSVALGRVLARDPINLQDELDSVRKAESDRLGQEAIDRLIAEDKARKHTLGEL